MRSYLDRDFDKIVDAELQKFGPLLQLVRPECVSELRADMRLKIMPIVRTIEPDLLQMLRREFDAKFNENIGVLCLSEQWDSILMWGHYSQSHEGFVIGFDTDHQFFNQRRTEKDEFGYLRQIHYQKSRPIVSLMNSGGMEWFDTKADVWSYENEWRMIMPLSLASEVVTVAGVPIHLFAFPSASVKEVLFGSRCSEETERAIRGALIECNPQPLFARCDIDDADYRIVRKNT